MTISGSSRSPERCARHLLTRRHRRLRPSSGRRPAGDRLALQYGRRRPICTVRQGYAYICGSKSDPSPMLPMYTGRI